MANKRVTVTCVTTFYHEVMDEATVVAYIAAAQVAGYYTSPAGDIYLPFDSSAVVINDAEFEQATRDDTENFGPTP